MKRAIMMFAVLAACSTSAGDNKQVAQQGTTAAVPAPDIAAIRTAIEANNATIARLLSTGHADSVKQFYASDAVGMYANTKARMGADSIGAYWVGVQKMGAVMIDFKTSDIVVTDKGVLERGQFTFEIAPKGGKAMKDHGNYLVFWVQENGQWKLKYDIGATDLPPAK